jgi:hypothetical protein
MARPQCDTPLGYITEQEKKEARLLYTKKGQQINITIQPTPKWLFLQGCIPPAGFNQSKEGDVLSSPTTVHMPYLQLVS